MSGAASENSQKFEALCRVVERGQGEFAFVLVEFDLPSLRKATLKALSERLPGMNIVTIVLTPPPADELPSYNVLDQLNERVHVASPEKALDVLVILGFESLFLDARDPEKLKRAIQPLNLGRNILAQENPYPVLFCLPSEAMAVFLQSAPDLSSWRSGYYQFQSDQDRVRDELSREAAQDLGWPHWRRLHRTTLKTSLRWCNACRN